MVGTSCGFSQLCVGQGSAFIFHSVYLAASGTPEHTGHIECNWNGSLGLCNGVLPVMGIHGRAQLSSKKNPFTNPLSLSLLYLLIFSKWVAGVKTGGISSHTLLL